MTVSDIEKQILNKLLDKYESSKTFAGTNKTRQSFSLNLSHIYPDYADHSKLEIFKKVNATVDYLANKKLFINFSQNRSEEIKSVYLNIEKLDEIYNYLSRIPKARIVTELRELLKSYFSTNDLLDKFCLEQLERLDMNQNVKFFSGDLSEFSKILRAVKEIYFIESEMFLREFSIKLYKDSKAFETIQGKVESLLFEYGDFPEKSRVLASFNLVKTPSYVNFKGSGVLNIAGQVIDVRKFQGKDIALSSSLLSSIDEVHVTGEGKKLVTIENLTSFHMFSDPEYFAIYLGGFHNSARRDFIRKVAAWNSDCKFFHFGDIDAGGIYILDHLRRETGINFSPFLMNVETLKAHHASWKSLTENDRKRLGQLLDKTGIKNEFGELITFMLENNCKLEQEAVNIGISISK